MIFAVFDVLLTTNICINCRIFTFITERNSYLCVSYNVVYSGLHECNEYNALYCIPCCNVLISWLWQTLVSNCEQNQCQAQWMCWTYCQRLLLFVDRSLSMCKSCFDLQFSLSDTCDHENAVSIKDKASNERYLQPVTAVCIWWFAFLISWPTFSAYVSLQCLECYNCWYTVEAWLLITDDGGHVMIGWSEITGGYNTPDTVVKHRRRK